MRLKIFSVLLNEPTPLLETLKYDKKGMLVFQFYELKKVASKKEMRVGDEEEITWTRVAGDFELEQQGFEQDA